jgi:hypothetical protein
MNTKMPKTAPRQRTAENKMTLKVMQLLAMRKSGNDQILVAANQKINVTTKSGVIGILEIGGSLASTCRRHL